MTDPLTHVAFAAPEPDSLAPLFPGYSIEGLIAVGGMGAVYHAVQKSLDRNVAIKILPQEFSQDAAFCAGFEAEAKAMARLNHPNLIGVYDFGEVNGMLFIVMEYVPGKSLFHSAHGLSIEPSEVIRLVTGICNGLAHAHQNGIIHRDIKPSNVLLDLNAQPKIGDFGLAQPIGKKADANQDIYGTPHYTAPEVVHSPQSVGHRADIFSVGVILHELLTGCLPANDSRPASIISHCDPRFDAVIRCATNPVPELRYASATELAQDLKAIQISAGPQVARPGTSRRAPAAVGSGVSKAALRSLSSGRRAKQSSGLSGILFLLLALAIGGIAYYLVSKSDKAQQPSVVPSQSDPASEPSNPPGTKDPEPTPPAEDPKPTPPAEDPNSTPPTDPVPKPEGPLVPPVAPIEPITPPPVEPPAKPAVSFNVPDFLTRARKIMLEKRAAPLILNRDKSLEKNLQHFYFAANRTIRKIPKDDKRWKNKAEAELKAFMNSCRRNGNRLFKVPSEDLPSIEDSRLIQIEFFEKQPEIDKVLMDALTELSATYVLGIDNQIERLKATNDTPAIELLEEELDSIRKDPAYFAELMGVTPHIEKDS
jgi:serine/threonine protein kinase